MTIQEILSSTELSIEQKLSLLKTKTITVPAWVGNLEKQYDPDLHPVMNREKYPDIIRDGKRVHVTRVKLGLQKLATKRMTELVCGIPIKRVYKPKNKRQKDVAAFLEKIYTRNRIDAINVQRFNMLFAGCEVFTLWYAVEQNNNLYGRKSPIKIRCRNFSPMLGHLLYPLFDEYGDMVAMSVEYQRKVVGKTITYFDTYTSEQHIKYSNESGEWTEVENEPITIGKIPAVYAYRNMPIWEEYSDTVYEMEWALSRNGNYLRDNSKPRFVVFADKVIKYGDEKDSDTMSVMQYPVGSNAGYITWQQAVENLKFHINECRSFFFTLLQLPDWSYEKMSQLAISGESRKQMFIDAQLKVKDESGIILEMCDREVNVNKEFAKVILGDEYERDIEELEVETVITPFTITDNLDKIKELTTANGGMPIMSQRESIEEFGYSDDVDKTLQEITEQEQRDILQPEQYI